MKTIKLKNIISIFHQDLNHIYSEREIKNHVYDTFQYILGFSKSDCILRKEEEIDYIIFQKIINIIESLKQHVPIQYILGFTEFYGLKLKVTPDVLIPRSETEELINWLIKEYGNKKITILDIGTGSGCVAIALKKHMLKSTVYAFDISDNALKVAEYNANINNTEIRLYKKDILNVDVNEIFPEFDIIVSNPPYVKESEKSYIKKNVLNYEPHEALFVPDDKPLLFYEAIINFSKSYLLSGGSLFFEINETMSTQLAEMLKNGGFCDIQIKKDINDKYRMLKCLFFR